MCIISNASLSTKTVPAAWKPSCIVPVTKRPVISSMKIFRPVALTSAVMKVCELVVFCKLEKITSTNFKLPTEQTGVPTMLFYTV